MICSGEPLAEVIPSASATTRSSIPNAFQPQTSALPCPRSASQATGNASAPVMISPQPAEYGNGPASRPSAARSRKNPPPRRQTFRPIRKGIGIPSSVVRTDGEIEAATAAATSGDAMTVPIITGPTAFEPRNRFAAASAAARPVQRPAPTERAIRCDGVTGMAPVSALMLTMIAATRTMVPMKSSMASLLTCKYTYLNERDRCVVQFVSPQISGFQKLQRCLAVDTEQLSDMRLRLRPERKAAAHHAPALTGNVDHPRAWVITGMDRNPPLLLQRREVAGQRRALHAENSGQLADRHFPSQHQLRKDGELGDANSRFLHVLIVQPRDLSRGLPRRQAETAGGGHIVDGIAVARLLHGLCVSTPIWFRKSSRRSSA